MKIKVKDAGTKENLELIKVKDSAKIVNLGGRSYPF